MCRITRPAAVDQLLEQLRPVAPRGTGTDGPAANIVTPGLPAGGFAACLLVAPVCEHGVRVDLDHCWDCGDDGADLLGATPPPPLFYPPMRCTAGPPLVSGLDGAVPDAVLDGCRVVVVDALPGLGYEKLTAPAACWCWRGGAGGG